MLRTSGKQTFRSGSLPSPMRPSRSISLPTAVPINTARADAPINTAARTPHSLSPAVTPRLLSRI